MNLASDETQVPSSPAVPTSAKHCRARQGLHIEVGPSIRGQNPQARMSLPGTLVAILLSRFASVRFVDCARKPEMAFGEEAKVV